MVYGFASLVTAFAGSFTAGERLPLIYFLICFPVLVLCVFAWLVSKHSGKLVLRLIVRHRFVLRLTTFAFKADHNYDIGDYIRQLALLASLSCGYLLAIPFLV